MNCSSAFIRFSVLASLLIGAISRADAWSQDVFDAYLAAGRWSASADDNISGETIPFVTVERVFKQYCQSPSDHDARENVGILALTIAAANWGIDEAPARLGDPREVSWASTSDAFTGKHVMSYVVGGVGISHADVGDLRSFLKHLAEDSSLPADQRTGVRRLAETVRYAKGGVVYDELRAAGVCTRESFDTDLDGVKFNHGRQRANRTYCQTRRNPALSAADWRLFRTVVRRALQTKGGQEWLLRLWLNKYWNASLAAVKPGPGFIEEAMVNARIRNSTPKTADSAARSVPASATPEDRVARELRAYGRWNRRTLDRRRGTMLRPVILYRSMAAKLRTQGINCP